MSKNILQNSAKKISKDLAPHYLPSPMYIQEYKKRKEEKTPLLQKNKESIESSNPSSLNIPQTNFSNLLKSKTDPTKPDGFFTRLSKSRIAKRAAIALSWVTSKGAVRLVNVVIPAVAFSGIGALSGGIVPAIALGIALAVTAYNSWRDTRALRANKDLEQERKLLQEYKAAKSIEHEAIGLIKHKMGIDISEPAINIEASTSMKSKFKSKNENNLTARSLRKTIMDGLFEASGNAATVAVVATSGLASATMNALSVGTTAGILTIVDIVLTTRMRSKLTIVKNAMRKEIDTMREGVPAYKSLEELQSLTQRQKITTEALRQVLKEDISKLDETSLRERLSQETIKTFDNPEFAMPKKPSFWEKTKQYFKDVHMVHWPNNDYYTPEKFAAKNDRDTAAVISKYSNISQEIKLSQNNVEGVKQAKTINHAIPAPQWIKTISSKSSKNDKSLNI